MVRKSLAKFILGDRPTFAPPADAREPNCGQTLPCIPDPRTKEIFDGVGVGHAFVDCTAVMVPLF